LEAPRKKAWFELLEFGKPAISLVLGAGPLRAVSRRMGRSRMSEGAWLYILRCADSSYYVGTTRTSLDIRLAQHNDGTFPGYTSARRPVELMFSQWFDRIADAIENELKLKRWSRAKKEALIRGDFASLQQLAKRKSSQPPRRPPMTGSSG
jgi:putative endonuclease